MTLDIADTIIPKSDQLNADDLIAGPRVITITKVVKRKGSKDTPPLVVSFDGDDGKPYLPCLSMRRALVYLWGKDASKWAGRSLRLYRDPAVVFGGVAVGGIRISHATHINARQEFPLTASKTQRKMYRVEPLDAGELRSPPYSFADGERDGGGQGSSSPPQSNEPPGFDDEPIVIEPPAKGASEKAWKNYAKEVRALLEGAPTTAVMREIAEANKANIDTCPSEGLRKWIREPLAA